METTTIHIIAFVLVCCERQDFSLIIAMMRLESFLSQQTNHSCFLRDQYHQPTKMPHPDPANSPSPPTTSIIELEDSSSPSPSFHSLSPLAQTMTMDDAPTAIRPPLAQMTDNNNSPALSVAPNHVPLAQMTMDEESEEEYVSLLLMTLLPARPPPKVTTKTKGSPRPS
jgi:hypothetical protein